MATSQTQPQAETVTEERPQAHTPEPHTEREIGAKFINEWLSQESRLEYEKTYARREEFELNQRLATAFMQSGCFQDIIQEGGRMLSQKEAIARALVKIELGKSMGFSPAESMSGIDIIKGRVAVGANLRAARMQRNGYSWVFKQLDEKGCVMDLYYKDARIGDSSFTDADASRAGLKEKDNYKKNPRNMYFARAITNAQRWYAPGVLGIDVLSSEEAYDVPRASDVMTGSVSLDNVKASAAQNRGHDGAKPQASKAQAAPMQQQPTKELTEPPALNDQDIF